MASSGVGNKWDNIRWCEKKKKKKANTTYIFYPRLTVVVHYSLNKNDVTSLRLDEIISNPPQNISNAGLEITQHDCALDQQNTQQAKLTTKPSTITTSLRWRCTYCSVCCCRLATATKPWIVWKFKSCRPNLKAAEEAKHVRSWKSGDLEDRGQ